MSKKAKKERRQKRCPTLPAELKERADVDWRTIVPPASVAEVERYAASALSHLAAVLQSNWPAKTE